MRAPISKALLMSSPLSISIIICTHNRAVALKRTLDSLGTANVPVGAKVEILVVDNASTDDTARTVQSATLKNAVPRYLMQSKKGLSNARNAGLANARGEIILFTDDDVIVAQDWIEEMAAPLAAARCDAVTGQVTLAPDVLKHWMSRMHKGWVASSLDAQMPGQPVSLVGASMGFRRPVLERVPGFDSDLGPGALGYSDDTLFGWQLSQAGFKIEFVPTARAVHHLDVSRLQRRNWLNDARKRGRTRAYIIYHWEHENVRAPMLEWLSFWARLRLRRVLQPPPSLHEEGCPTWEMSYIMDSEKCRQFCLERQRPRNYSRRGLIKRNS